MVALWKPLKDRDASKYVDNLLKRLAAIDLLAKKAIQITGPMFQNLKMTSGDRHATPYTQEQWNVYANGIRKYMKDMLQAINQLDQEYGEYEKHLKKKKAKPIKRAEQAWKKYRIRVDAFQEHVAAIERHARR